MHRGRGLVPLGLLLFAALGAFGVQLHGAQEDSHRAAERRFEQRAQISAALTQSVFGALSSLSGDELARQFSGSPARSRARLARQLKASKMRYLALLDARGAVVARAGDGRPPTGERSAPGFLSDVRQTDAGPLIDFALPFKAAAGERVLVQGIPAGLLRSFLDNYLRRLPNPDGAVLVVADGGGTVLARVVAPGRRAAPSDPLTTAAMIPGTSWRLRLQAERAEVLAGSGGGAWVGWMLLGGLALAILAGLWMCARVMRSSRRTHAANRALRESEGKLRGLVGALEEAVFLVHRDGRVELLNESAKALTETDADVVTEPTLDWLPVTDDGVPMSESDTPAARSFARGTSERSIMGLDRPGHDRLWLEVSTRPLMRPGETSPYAVVCTSADVTARQNLEAHLLDLADRDPLTGLWNRRRFEQDLAHQLDRCRRYDERAALVLMDVDNFKQVNDVLGHLAGDEVLCALGDALSLRLRVSDRAARLGGDEFAVLLLDVDEQGATAAAEQLAAHLCLAAGFAQEHVRLSISVGTAMLDRSSAGVNAALEGADRAMYAAKQRPSGRRTSTSAQPPVAGATTEMASLRALLAAVNARDSYTAMHSREVVTLARAVARQLGLDEAQRSEVEHIALLHDLGKIAVPDAILRKPGPLTDHEQVLMRQHPVVGAEILASMPELAHLAPSVRAEHERWDGGGYPDGLAGEQIPIASRIVFVCDAYHAMTSNRPYRRAMSAAAAREEIRREAGEQFCPFAAAALLDGLTCMLDRPAAVGAVSQARSGEVVGGGTRTGAR
jgi:diguanylate cyclase (GGDEF)-like protein/putative nucleotidyltransferase with HDIG domain